MALKPDRYEQYEDISFFYNAGVAQRGGVVVYGPTEGSGAAMDQGDNVVQYKSVEADDIPVGLLLQDVVNKDLTRTHLNIHKDEVQIGSKVDLLIRGYVVTNLIEADANVAAGAAAYASAATPGYVTTSGLPQHVVGRFRGGLDADGYAKLELNLPNNAV